MSKSFAVALALVGYSVLYGLCATFLIGALQMGDCIDAAACARSKDATSIGILVVAVALYPVTIYYFFRWRRR
jgi:hypothetical protein